MDYSARGLCLCGVESSVSAGLRRRRTVAFGVVSSVCAAFAMPTVARGQDGGTCMEQVYDGAVSSQTVEDIETFHTLAYERLTTSGIPAAAGAFQLVPGCPASDFFSPIRAADAVMGLLGLSSASGCTILGSLDTGAVPNLSTDQWNTVYEYLTDGRIVTNIVSQPEETLVVIDLVTNAPSDDDVFVSIEGDRLIVTGLDPISAPPGVEQWSVSAQNVSPETNLMILGLVQNSEQIVQQIIDLSAEHGLNGPDPLPGYGVHQTQALLLGGAANGHPSRADLVEAALSLYLQSVFSSANVTVDRLDAVWGIYGTLPMALVITPDAYLLVDATTGSVAGPFEPGSPLNADALFSLHPEVIDLSRSHPTFQDRFGCMMQVPPTWQTTPPPGWTPSQPVPNNPVTTPIGRPTHWTNYHCVPIVGGRCRCVSEGSGTGGAPPQSIKTRVVCVCSPNANNDCSPNGNPGYPGTPPTMSPALLTGCTCNQQEWLY